MIFYRAQSRDAGEEETFIVQAQRASHIGANFWPANFPANWDSVRDHRHVLPMVDASAAIGHFFRDGDEGDTTMQAPTLQPAQSELGVPFRDTMYGVNDSRGTF